MRSPCSSSSPATPLKYHFTFTCPAVAASMSAPQRLISCASTLPSGATDANFNTVVGSSATAAAVTSETDSDAQSTTETRMDGAQ